MALFSTLFFLLALCCAVVQCQNQAPRFTQDMNNFSLFEATPVDALVFQLLGVDPEGQPLTFGINSDSFEVRQASSGEVYLIRELDYELEKSFKIEMWISDGVNMVTREAQINVFDSNDEKPKFTEQTYKITFRETAKVGDIVYSGLKVTDADAIGELLRITCVDTAAGSCSVFSFNVKSQSNREWVADIVLQQVLDYEAPNRPTQLRLEAFDGVNTQVKSLEIELIDVQDTPPKFSGSITAVINENVPTSFPVIRIVATDGDVDTQRPIRYSLLTNPGGLFSIDQESGQVITVSTIDSESTLLRGGFVKIRVKACERYNQTAVDTAPKSCSEVEVTITVNDLNDNTPTITIEPASGEFNMLEDTANDVAVPKLELTVTDKDLGARSEFELKLMTHTDVFKVVPNVGTGLLKASIVVKNASLIDYDLRQKAFELHIVARETKTPEKLQSDAYITVKLVDVNDNSPIFPQDSYTASVRELASSRTPVIRITATDLDSGTHGTAGIRYKLWGVGSEYFIVDIRTGQINVRGCFNPGGEGCIDYERAKSFALQFIATDDLGEGNRAQVPVTINIINENDNEPRFNLPSYASYIMEGEAELDPPLVVEATDGDGDPITYTILNGNEDGQWQINPTTGEITATRPVDYETTPGGFGYYNLTIQAADPLFKVTATARIFVIDSNDHEPVFNPSYYEVSIPENTAPGEVVETLLATDEDPSSGPNGEIQYRIIGGSLDKFIIDPVSGRVTVAPGATFDFDVQKRYLMTVIGQDQGQPQKQAEATLVVNILDANNKNPFFRPATIRTSVLENEPLAASVITVKAEDPDTEADLVYYFEEPRSAVDPNNDPVNINDFDFTGLFSIDRDTGLVKVNQPLDHTTVAQVTYTVRVVDNSAVGPQQTAQATLIITILKVNDQPPIFGPPWTPDNPFLEVSVREAQGEGSYITTLVASDPGDTIDEYRLISNPNGHFEINPQTGVVTVVNPLDYETDKTLQVVAVAVDNGQPQLTSTATININIININDENPTFGKDLYEVEIYENSPKGTPVVKVTVTDLDLEDFGEVRYELGDDDNNQFDIDPLTGQITVAEGAVLDRETEPVISLTAKVYDSPNNPDVRRYASVPVYITLLDVNDETPTLLQRDYKKNILENVPTGTSVIQLTAFDGDEGDNAKITYEITSGNENGFFKIDPDTGLVTTAVPILGQVMDFNLTVRVSDGGGGGSGGGGMSSYGFIYITVLPANNGAPVWVLPSQNNLTIGVLENQYLGMEVITVYAEDKDYVTYGFLYNGNFVQETPNFEINPYSGMITAKRVFDREEKDSYTLLLVARDSGTPPFDSQRYIIIQILDTDDHDPVFPTFRNCCTKPYELQVPEEYSIGTVLGKVVATDKDIGANADIQYFILSGNDGNIFRLNATTGELRLNAGLDYEVRNRYILTIEAQDGSRDLTEMSPTCKCQNPSLVRLIVNVVDNNDFAVVFPVDFFTACVPMDASIGRKVTTITAKDPDTDATTGFTFSLSGIRNYVKDIRPRQDAFVIGVSNGSVRTNSLMSNYERDYFTMNVRVTDVGDMPADTELKVWVTMPSQEVTLTFESTISQVQTELPNILDAISRATNNGIVCVEDLRYHVNADGVVVKDWSDLVIYVVDGRGLYVLDADRAVAIIGATDALMGAYAIAAVKESYGAWGGFLTWPILVAIIVIAVLILLALLLLCLLCYCCKWGAFYEEEYYAVKEPIIYADTINPLWKLKLNEYEDQELTMSMKEQMAAAGGGAGMVNHAFEASEGYMNGSAALNMESRSHLSTSRYEDMVDAVDADDVRIEADLVPARGSAAGGTSVTQQQVTSFSSSSAAYNIDSHQTLTSNGSAPKPYMISEATMTDREQQQAIYISPPSLSPPISPRSNPSVPSVHHQGPALIGATLTTRQYRQKVIGETYSDIGGVRDARYPSMGSGTLPHQGTGYHESVQNSSYYGEPVFTTYGGTGGSLRDVRVSGGGGGGRTTQYIGGSGPISPGMLSEPYEGTIHLGNLSTGGGSTLGHGRRYKETHERTEYEEGYIDSADDNRGVFVYPS